MFVLYIYFIEFMFGEDFQNFRKIQVVSFVRVVRSFVVVVVASSI